MAEDGILGRDVEMHVKVFERSGRCVFEHRMPLNPASHLGDRGNLESFSPEVETILGSVRHPRLWSAERPELYVLTVELTGAVQYRRRSRFGFRSFEAKGGKLYFNGKPFFVRAPP